MLKPAKSCEQLIKDLSKKLRAKTGELNRLKEELFFEIVDKKVTEEELRENEQKYRSIVENAIEGIFQITPDGNCIMANPALVNMLGYGSSEELISESKDLGSNPFNCPEKRYDFEQLLERQGYIKAYNTEFCKKNGDIIWVSMHVRAVRDIRGNLLCYEGTIEDVTEHRKQEEALRGSYEKLSRTMDGTVKALSTTVEVRDPYTAGHQQRVTRLAVEIAGQMGLPEQNIKAVKTAGILHDIGKLYVPAEILSKPGRISSNEFNIIKDHSQAGYGILKEIEFEYPVAEIVFQHHERMNGSGYPRKLNGEDIVIEARIIAVADVVESMASHRPYRPTLGIEAALEETTNHKSTLYDPAVVEACVALFMRQGFHLC